MSSDAIALELGITPNSAVTYRKRAYSRLGIASQNELFALCYFG
jgi:DNA-binding CsgD family transcriptional regulator